MDMFFFQPALYEKLYNCTFYNVNSIPEQRKRHKLLGVVMLMFWAVCVVLYVPCVITMICSSLRKRSSYQLMILLGVFHLLGLHTSGLMTGIFMYIGGEFCRFPTQIYFIGMLGLCTWCGSTMTSFILGVNRCCELYNSIVAERFFGGLMRYFWLILLVIYTIIPSINSMPPIYEPVMMSWFFNPHHAYFDDFGGTYYNVLHTFHNIFVCVAHTGVYIVFVGLYLWLVRGAKKKKLKDKNTYIQVISIGLIHFLASLLYVMQQFSPMTFCSSFLASLFYVLSQGIPPFIYLKYNKTIWKGTFQTFCPEKVKQTTSSRKKETHISTSSVASNELH